jgi:hypothetical protein
MSFAGGRRVCWRREKVWMHSLAQALRGGVSRMAMGHGESNVVDRHRLSNGLGTRGRRSPAGPATVVGGRSNMDGWVVYIVT